MVGSFLPFVNVYLYLHATVLTALSTGPKSMLNVDALGEFPCLFPHTTLQKTNLLKTEGGGEGSTILVPEVSEMYFTWRFVKNRC